MIYRLFPQIQHYAWGGFSFLPELLDLPAPQPRPFAELWMGAHPSAPSKIGINGASVSLQELIRNDADTWLGPDVAARFGGTLPFLFKLLDVRQMLSIQAHPAKIRAEAGFRRENELGIALHAPHRVYKDDNHKPEVALALSEFWLLHGFRAPEAVRAELELLEELQPLLDFCAGNNAAGLYRHLMEMPQEEVDALLLPLRRRLQPQWEAGALPKSSPDYWAALAFRDFELPGGHCDRGIFSIYLLNLVKLQPGQAIYQAAGIPHAYLEGQNVELMANSDNVFRGGLTPKYIAVQELIGNLNFEPVTPEILNGSKRAAWETVFPTPAPDFELSSIRLPEGEFFSGTAAGPEILFILEGSISVNGKALFKRGESIFVQPGTAYRLMAVEDACLYKAGPGAPVWPPRF